MSEPSETATQAAGERGLLLEGLETATTSVHAEHVYTATPLTQGTVGGKERLYKQPDWAEGPWGWSGSSSSHRTVWAGLRAPSCYRCREWVL